jgi:hypothetical protein
VIQKLKSDKLIDVNGKTMTILDWEKLQEVAEFDPHYLHLRDLPP